VRVHLLPDPPADHAAEAQAREDDAQHQAFAEPHAGRGDRGRAGRTDGTGALGAAAEGARRAGTAGRERSGLQGLLRFVGHRSLLYLLGPLGVSFGASAPSATSSFCATSASGDLLNPRLTSV